MCRLFSYAESYHEDPNVVSGALKTIEARETSYRYDGFDEQAGYTMSIRNNILGHEELQEEMAQQLYHDVIVPFPANSRAALLLTDLVLQVPR